MRSFKIVASRGDQVVFDDRVEAATPRDARRELKRALNVDSLTGIVYAITEIPVELIRAIVREEMSRKHDARVERGKRRSEAIAAVEKASPVENCNPADGELPSDELKPILRRIRRLTKKENQ